MIVTRSFFRSKDIPLNLSHFLDHFIMLIFAKAAFDAGREFGLSYEEIIVYGTLGVVLFGAAAPLAGWLADKYSRAILITVYPLIISIVIIQIAEEQHLHLLELNSPLVCHNFKI